MAHVLTSARWPTGLDSASSSGGGSGGSSRSSRSQCRHCRSTGSEGYRALIQLLIAEAHSPDPHLDTKPQLHHKSLTFTISRSRERGSVDALAIRPKSYCLRCDARVLLITQRIARPTAESMSETSPESEECSTCVCIAMSSL